MSAPAATRRRQQRRGRTIYDVLCAEFYAAVGTQFLGPAPLPQRPTRHLAGSEQKLRVLRRRFARREQLFHPLDAQLPLT